MPWCPKCKLEYREGMTVCSDCGEMLVDTIDEMKEPSETIMSTSEPELAERFLAFLRYSHIESGETGFSPKTEEYEVSVAKSDSQEAKKLFRAFYIKEQEDLQIQKQEVKQEESIQKESETDLPEDEQAKANAVKLRTEAANVYVRKKDKYEDLSSTATMFFVFGILGLLFVAANAAGLIHFISGVLPFTVYSVLFIGCIMVGITTKKRAMDVQSQIAAEDGLTTEINRWLDANVNQQLLDTLTDPSLSEEINYMNQTAKIKEMIQAEFTQAENGMIEEMIEEFYSSHFEAK